MLTLFQSKFIKAYKGLPARDLPVGDVLHPAELIDRLDDDAHFACYFQPGREVGNRLAKASVRSFDPVDMPIMAYAALDIDCPDHKPWGEDLSFRDQVLEAMAAKPDIFDGCGMYATRGGLRVLIKLAQPVPVSHADSLLSQLLTAASGVPGLDTSCRDWTRLFRAPYVVRDGVAQNWDHVLPFTPPTTACAWKPAALVAGACPAPGADVTGPTPPRESRPKTPTKTELKGLDEKWLRLLVKGYPLESRQGYRHQAIVACAVALAQALEPKSPIEIFAPMMASIEAMGNVDRFWGEAWNACCWVVGYSLAQADEEAQARTEAAYENLDFLAKLAQQSGCSVSEAKKRLLVWAGGGFWVMNPGTFQYEGPYRRENLVPALRDYLIEFCNPTDSLPNLLRDIGDTAIDLCYHYGAKTYYDGSVMHASMVTVRRPEPVFHKDVDDYLRLWGPKALDWFSQVWSVDKPCAALFLVAGPSVGKSLLATLAFEATGGSYVPFEDLAGDFNDGLRRSWFVWADEGIEFPSSKSPATILRALIGNSSHGVNVKYQDTSRINGYLRLILTANNQNLLRFRAALNEDDIAALEERVVFLNPSKEDQSAIATHLQTLRDDYARQHGYDPTDSRAPNYLEDVWRGQGVFLEHLSWLAENHVFERGRRFIVSGTSSEWSSGLRTRHGVQAALVGALCRAASSTQGSPVVEFQGTDGKVYVNAPLLLELWDQWAGGEDRPNSNRVIDGLRALSGGNHGRYTFASQGRVNYWLVSAETLAKAGEDMGLPKTDLIKKKAGVP